MTKEAVIYARVSSAGDRQSTDRQVEDLTAFAQRWGLAVRRVFTEHLSGAAPEKPVLQECVEFCKAESCCLLVSEISRLGRTVKTVIDTVDDLSSAGISVYIQDINLWTLTEEGKANPLATMIVTVLSSFAQIERENIKFRLNSGREAAKKRGVRMGRPQGSAMSAKDLLAKYPEAVRRLRRGQSVRDVARLCKISPSTVQRLRKALK